MLAIEISNNQVNLVEGICKGNKVHIKHCTSVALKEGWVKNGMIANLPELAEALRVPMKRYGYKSKRAAVVINSTSVVTREVTVPEVKPKEMHSLLYGEVEMAASSRQEYVLDYVVLERFKQENANVCRVLCIVVPRMLVETCHDLVQRQLGLKAVTMDITTHALYKLLCRDEARLSSGEAVIIANIQEDELCLVLAEGESKVYFRTTAINTAKTADVMESEYILSAFGGNEAVTESTRRNQTISATTENISKLIQFQTIKNKEKPVREILLTGSLSEDAEFVQRISESVGLSVKTFEKPAFVTGPQTMEFGRFAGAIGLLLSI